MELKDTPWKKCYDQPRQHIKKQRHYFANKGLSSQRYGSSSSHAWMWELDCKESWAPKFWFFWTVVLENTLESPLDCKEIQPVHPKGNLSWVFIGRTDAEAAILLSKYFLYKLDWMNAGDKWSTMPSISRRRRGRQRMRWWMASPTRWAWVLVDSGSWWWTGRPGVLRFMRSQRSRTRLSDWTELNWTDWCLQYRK